jgi:hypothetical protein
LGAHLRERLSRRPADAVIRPEAAARTVQAPSGVTTSTANLMPRNGAIIFGDLVGKLDMLHVECVKCSSVR